MTLQRWGTGQYRVMMKGIGLLGGTVHASATETGYCHAMTWSSYPAPINDVWIAALVLQNGLTLYARDAHFDHLPQLMRI